MCEKILPKAGEEERERPTTRSAPGEKDVQEPAEASGGLSARAESGPHPMIFRITVGAPGRDEVDDPAERPSRPDPRDACDEQPDDADQYSTVINLSDSGNEKAQEAC